MKKWKKQSIYKYSKIEKYQKKKPNANMKEI